MLRLISALGVAAATAAIGMTAAPMLAISGPLPLDRMAQTTLRPKASVVIGAERPIDLGTYIVTATPLPMPGKD